MSQFLTIKALLFFLLFYFSNLIADNPDDLFIDTLSSFDTTKSISSTKGDTTNTTKNIPSTSTQTKKNLREEPPISTEFIKEIVSSQSLRAVAFLWTEKDEMGIIRPGNGIVNKPPSGAAYQLFSEITAKPTIKSFNYKKGDTIEILKSLRFVHFNNKTANLIKRTGRAIIKEVKEKEVKALLFEVWDVISGEEMISPSTPVYGYSVDTLFKPELPISTKIFTKIEETLSPYPMQMIILDKGKNNGIGLGDVFGIYHHNKQGISELSAIGSVVYVDDISATVRIILMHNLTVAEGDEALLIRRPRLTILE